MTSRLVHPMRKFSRSILWSADAGWPCRSERRSTSSHQSRSSMQRAFDLFQQLADVVQTEARPQPEVLRINLEGFGRRLSPHREPDAEQFVDRFLERTARF